MQKDLIQAIRRRVGQALPTGVPLLQTPAIVGGALGSMAKSAGYKLEEEASAKNKKLRLLQKGLAGKQKPIAPPSPSRMKKPFPSKDMENSPEPVPSRVLPSFQDFMKEKAMPRKVVPVGQSEYKPMPMPRIGSPDMGKLKEMIRSSPLKKRVAL